MALLPDASHRYTGRLAMSLCPYGEKETTPRMAELKVYLSEDLDRRFRMLAMNVYGYGRGSLSQAAVDALTKWCERHEADKLDQPLKEASPHSNSDPISRAEERPDATSPGTKENSGSSLPIS